MSKLVDIGIVNQDLDYIYKLGIMMLSVALIGAVCSAVASYFSAEISSRFGETLRERVYEKVQSVGLPVVHNMGVSSLITRTTHDVTQVQNVLQMFLRVMLLAPVMCVGGVVMALFQDVRLSSVIFVGVLMLVVGISLIMRNVFPVFQTVQKQMDRLNLVVREGLTGIRVIRAFHRIKWEKERFHHANAALRDAYIQAHKLMSLNTPVIMMAFNLSMIFILWYGSNLVADRELQIGQLMAFIQYTTMILISIVLFSMLIGTLPRAIVSARRITELLAEESERDADRTDGQFLPVIQSPLTVEFRDVTFRYPGTDRDVLKGISFSAKEGK